MLFEQWFIVDSWGRYLKGGKSLACKSLFILYRLSTPPGKDVEGLLDRKWNSFLEHIIVDFSQCLEWMPTVWTLILVQTLGLGSALLARISEGSSRQTPCQCVFMLAMAVVGLATIFSFWLNVGGWFLSGITLSIMVVAATWDSRHGATVTV